MKFLKLVGGFKNENDLEQVPLPVSDKNDLESGASASGIEPKENPRMKKSKHSLACKRRQRLTRNKRKKEEKKLFKRGLTAVIQDLKKENECLIKKFRIETTIKEKYFQMWRMSEKEKDRLKSAKLHVVSHSCNQKPAANECSSSKPNAYEILRIAPSLLEECEGTEELGRGRFGIVCLKKFRSSPVAVKYFDECTSAKLVEKEALFLRGCCHINLPIIYGMNNTQKPYFIVTQFYGNEKYQPVTLKSAISEDTATLITGTENWLHIVAQINDGLCYLHGRKVIHNDIKNDNIVIVCSSIYSFFSPVLVDFGKACLVGDAKKKVLSRADKLRYYKEHFHIAPEVIEGTSPQSIKSDMYSFGVVIARIFNSIKYRPLKELARHCLKPASTRCTSSELCSILNELVK